MSISARFDRFTRKIRPTDNHIKEARGQTAYMIDKLKNKVAADGQFTLEKVLKSGSNAKFTSLRRTEEKIFDVDLAAYYSGEGATRDKLDNLLHFTCDQLRSIYSSKPPEDFEPLKSVVRVKFRSGIKLNVDVAPIICDDSLGIETGELAKAVANLNRICRGERLSGIQIVCTQISSGNTPFENNLEKSSSNKPINMKTGQNTSQVQKFFESEQVYPNDVAKSLYERLVGLDDHKKRLLIELKMLLYPEQLEAWSRKHHKGNILRVCEQQCRRVPLVLLEGDVGTGKTALAETIGDALARNIGGKARVHFLKINSQVRGTGLVGEMSDLIVQAFVQAETYTASLKREPVLLLLDEADALAASRDTQQMHHEDKAGLNTLLQRLDNLRLTNLPIAVIFITNRPDALDPAIRRRAALDLTFKRPGDNVRAEIIKTAIPELNWTEDQIDKLVQRTGSKEPKNQGIGFTASDLTNRLIVGALREAFSQDRALRVEDFLEQACQLVPTPQMGTS